MRWSWYVERDNKCWDETFATPDLAVQAMKKRMGDHLDADDDVVEKMARVGIYLATVQVTIRPLMVLRDKEKT